MTKEHFIALADVFVGTKPSESLDLSYTVGRESQWEQDLLTTCNYLSTLPNFNRGRWLDYVYEKCGSSGGKL